MDQYWFHLLIIILWGLTFHLAWSRRDRLKGFTDLPPARMVNVGTMMMGAFVVSIALIVVVLDLIFDI